MAINVVKYIIDTIKEFGIERFGRYYSVYRGIVTDNSDPERLGRVKVRVPEISGKVAIKNWAMPKFGLHSNNKKGVLVVPDIGDYVWVSFQTGDIRYPVYDGGMIIEGIPDEFIKGYPYRRGIKTNAGHVIIIDDNEGAEAIVIKHSKNSYFMFDKDGGIVYGTADGNYFSMSVKDGGIQIRNKDGHGVIIGSNGVMIIDKSGNYININESVDIISSKQVSVYSNGALINSGNVILGQKELVDSIGGGVYIGSPDMITALNTFSGAMTTASATLMAGLAVLPNATTPQILGGLVGASVGAYVTTVTGAITALIEYLTGAPSKTVKASK